MINLVAGLIALGIGFRLLKGLAGLFWYGLVFAFVLYLTNEHVSRATVAVPSYEELVQYTMSCERADEQLSYLKSVKSYLKLDVDPDALNDNDRIYNSRLKATIWWYAYTCGKS